MHRATSEGEIGFHPKCAKLHLSHLSFADDLLLFSEVSLSSLQGVKLVLAEFQQLSGLGVSYDKSEMYYCGISTELKHQLAVVLGIRLGKFSVRYLGVPLFSGKLTIADCALILSLLGLRLGPLDSYLLLEGYNWFSLS